ncbi:phage tail protein I [Candidatus Regiella insecticola]|uniref:Phage tail protein I n=1 Tax=Candidatus Regiella insecticola TaxID=138073 RepID=A0A6L2ZSC6_9ENTR|nr:phage tail protein I [Candidatus Regiella insecticola]GFN47419.1 phage tail protein I [Candidatus Regiella insecticola]
MSEKYPKSLLPYNATDQERALEETSAQRLTVVKIPLRTLWDPKTCPEDLLPWLAWALSVDRWDQNWSAAEKRAIIEASMFIHQHKGTVAAIRRVIKPFGYTINITEWWQKAPKDKAKPHTFQIDLGIQQVGISNVIHTEIERLVEDAKPLRSHIEFSLHGETSGRIYLGAAIYSGEIITVYPYQAVKIEVAGLTYLGAALHLIDTVTVQPKSVNQRTGIG